ncbi:Crp/Fnr family transcriptional regulator [Thalassovita sp.]|uniref:Crp/Fnr family transcriptional regulator n=1 Tax=Thalassovita sp. TaxID=1979401 RepID=UPI0029DE7309|nr:cyclic nucleotide-binding domain-containing protein [Thalassovita sp.]
MLDMMPRGGADSALLSQLPQDVRNCLLGRARIRRFGRGETICLQGEPAGALKIITHGWIKLYRVSDTGHEALLATLTAGQSFDEIASLMRAECPSSAEALCECEVMFIDLTTACGCRNAVAEITRAVMSAASDHMQDMMDQIEALKSRSGVERLSEYLLALSDETGGNRELVLPFDKVVLAAKLGMKPESLSRAFARLKRFGVQSELKRVVIQDVAKLKTLARETAAYA